MEIVTNTFLSPVLAYAADAEHEPSLGLSLLPPNCACCVLETS